jgi:hypothetical protein
MGPGEPASAPSAAEPPRSWTFDEDESWGADVEPPTDPGADAMPAGATTTGASDIDPLTTDTDPSWTDLSGTESASGATAAPAAALLDVPPSEAAAQATRTMVAHPGRMLLGMASLAAERLRGGMPARNAFVTGVGLFQETAAGVRDLGRRMMQPASRVAADTVDRAIDRAATLPGSAIPARSIAQSRATLARVMAKARSRGQATVAAGRADAQDFVQSSVAETLSWAQAKAVPQIVDGLVPHLVDEVVPRILEGALPEIRAKLLPAVIDDLAESPQVRDLMLEQGRGVVGDAAEHLRTTTASADDRVESAFRRLVKGGGTPEGTTDDDGQTAGEPSGPSTEGG